ncbi:MAG: CvpA family protein [Bacillota bacterium]
MIFDFLIIAILGGGFFVGWKRGLIKIVSGHAVLAVQLYAALRFNQWFGRIIDGYFDFTGKCTAFFTQHTGVVDALSTIQEKIPGRETLSSPQLITEVLLYFISFILLFILTKLLLKVLILIITKGLDRTLIGPVNRFAGGVLGLSFLGAIAGTICTYLSFALNKYPGRSSGFLGSLNEALSESKIIFYLFHLLGI